MTERATAGSVDPDIPAELASRIRRRGGIATIYDVAELANVSPSTVSRALAKPGRVSATTEARIRAIAEQVNFRVNPNARALHTGRSHTIALVVADITNPVIFDVVRGAEKAASDADYTLVIAQSQESGDTELEAVERLLPSVDGVILGTTRLADSRIVSLAARKPVVLINRFIENLPSVLPDVDKGVRELVGHLAGLGHRSIMYVSGPSSSWISARRLDALRAHAQSLGIALVSTGPVNPTIEGGLDVVDEVIASRVTAAVAFNDLIAIGLVQGASARGISVPGDLSVAGFDDIFGSELIVPSLTTVRSQLERAGAHAVRAILAMMAGIDSPAGDLLDTALVARNSTARPR